MCWFKYQEGMTKEAIVEYRNALYSEMKGRAVVTSASSSGLGIKRKSEVISDAKTQRKDLVGHGHENLGHHRLLNENFHGEFEPVPEISAGGKKLHDCRATKSWKFEVLSED